MDKIIMKGMQFYGYHGVLPEEEKLGQQFVIDLELQLNLQPAGQSDDINKSISYAEVYEQVKQITTRQRFQLIEALAEQIAEEVLYQYTLQQVKVTVKKPAAPVPGNFDYMAVEIVRKNKGV